MALFCRFNIIPAFLSAMVGFSLFGSCSANDLPASYVFGDSLVDSGNNNYLASLSKANYAPNGIDLLPYRIPTGRFTNGRTIPDIVGQELGFPHFIPPYLAPTTAGDTILTGVNYASGGGGILNETGHIFGGRLNMDAQVDNFENTRQEIISMVGPPAPSKLLKKALFSVVIGSNDFINNYLTPTVSGRQRKSIPPEKFIGSMISKFRLQITRLYKLEARKLVIVNVGPIGCIPYQRDMNPNAGENCATLPNQLAQSFNNQLKNLVAELSQNLKEASFVYVDVYNIVSDIIQNYYSYGFENANSACCHSAGRFGGLVPCGPTSSVCVDRSKYVFWDAYHPSDAANIIIAKRLVDGNSKDVFPMNVRQLLQL
ncbi:GDSL esterase/lipase At4g16230-like [Aristolochia californica]|uniref:GDSL esterase/lipase At4g16230-like n=1 Tax=Aristolochia californica TaxID=171875 RepID=UPI0035E2A3A1